jgi:hypothetical protein
MTSFALCFLQAAIAFASSGRSERSPLSKLGHQLPLAAIEMVLNGLALRGYAIAVHALLLGGHPVIRDKSASHDQPRSLHAQFGNVVCLVTLSGSEYSEPDRGVIMVVEIRHLAEPKPVQ